VTTSERRDTRRRWAIAATASLLLHLSLLLWWRGVDVAPGGGSSGGHAGGRGGVQGFGPGSVIDVQIDVDAPVSAGTPVPAEAVAIESAPIVVATTPHDVPVGTATPESSRAGPPTSSGVGGGDQSGAGTGSGSEGTGEGFGSGDGGTGGGAGARTGSATGPGVGAAGGTVPPRPIEITWPDTRKLSHCVGLRIDVRIRVDELGRVERVEPASTGLPDDCVRAALETAKRIKFTPGTVAGKPATLWSLVTIDFEKGK
jgi:hypothetical protein